MNHINNITATGSTLTLIASKTYPVGIQLTQFSKGGDLFKFGESEIAKMEQTPNGAMVFYNVASTMCTIDISLIPKSEEDVALFNLAEANKSGVNKKSAGDVITLVINYPNFKVVYDNGKLLKAPSGYTVNNDGKMGDMTYSFAFERGTMLPL